jgi:hypothetical protein
MTITLPPITITVDVVISAAAVLLSLLANYIPKFNLWWAALDSAKKQLGMLFSITFICLVVGTLTWTGVWLLIPVGADGVVVLVFMWIQALIVNQTAYKYSPQLRQVMRTKALRPLPYKLHK